MSRELLEDKLSGRVNSNHSKSLQKSGKIRKNGGGEGSRGTRHQEEEKR